ncbi:MAG: enoyl-CoA hydratase/isomerase family protein [Kofleriaceae bacterium]|nr:enoyl-CoA hydratase/isomerase family protein [Myxococcales bacterium]MCB9563833.1 enoyl-CoA hydratase/isomerase family protein [Kofleriaceae bacterium]
MANLSDYENLTIEVDGPMALITIRREPQLNALSTTVLAELTTAVGELELVDDVRLVAITGAGDKAFVAGADIAEMQELSPILAERFAELGGALGDAIASATKPYVAAVHGFALGGGCELALACDFVYASPKAKFGQPEVKLGVIPGFGGTQRLARRCGVAKAKELCITGDTIDAAEALRIGLVDKLVTPAEGQAPRDALLAEVRALAERVAKNGPIAVSEVKRMMRVGTSIPLDAAIRLEQRTFGILFSTADQREGMAAFLAKRPAKFTGR